MKPPEMFGLAVRLLGLVFLYFALVNIPSLIIAISQGGGIWFGLLNLAWNLALAYWLIRGPRMLTNLAYPGSPS